MNVSNSPIQNQGDVKTLKVEYTTNLNQFSFINGNRVPNPMHIARLKKSMDKNGVLINPILINNNNEIIDGQHRYLAAKDLGLGVYYVIIGDYGLDEIHALNLNQKNWTNSDYMQGYANMGIEPYIRLRDFTQRFPQFSIGSSINIMAERYDDKPYGRKRLNSKGEVVISPNNHSFSEGNWECGSVENGIEIVNKLLAVGNYYGKYVSGVFVRTYIALLKKPNFKHTKFIHKLSQQPNRLVDCASSVILLLLIEEIYNYGNHHKVNLRY